MWTKLMCRVYAIIHIKAYRKKAVILTTVFLSALVIFCEVGCIATHSLSFGGLLALVTAVTLVFTILWEIFKRRDNNVDKRGNH